MNELNNVPNNEANNEPNNDEDDVSDDDSMDESDDDTSSTDESTDNSDEDIRENNANYDNTNPEGNSQRFEVPYLGVEMVVGRDGFHLAPMPTEILSDDSDADMDEDDPEYFDILPLALHMRVDRHTLTLSNRRLD